MYSVFEDCTNRLVDIAKKAKENPFPGNSPYETAKTTIHSVIARQVADMNVITHAMGKELLQEVRKDPLVRTELPMLTKKEARQKIGYIIPIPPNWNSESFARAEEKGIPDVIKNIRASLYDLETLRNLHHKNRDVFNSLGYTVVSQDGDFLNNILIGMRTYALKTVFPGENYPEMVEKFSEELKNSSFGK